MSGRILPEIQANPDLVVLVDARNVLRSQWPNIPEQEVLACSAAWAVTNGARAIVVFDGRAPGGLVGEREVDDACTVVGTGGESADDWLIRAATELAAENSRYWLVTSDRALRALAGRAAERTIGGGAFARELRP
jgi:predicted RNA-binding protein with PIN domain